MTTALSPPPYTPDTVNCLTGNDSNRLSEYRRILLRLGILRIRQALGKTEV